MYIADILEQYFRAEKYSRLNNFNEMKKILTMLNMLTQTQNGVVLWADHDPALFIVIILIVKKKTTNRNLPLCKQCTKPLRLVNSYLKPFIP